MGRCCGHVGIIFLQFWLVVWLLLAFITVSVAGDLAEIKQRGVLRHLGVPYAHFVTGGGDGLDVELVKLFAKRLGVRYQYVKSSWTDVIGDLTGEEFRPTATDVEVIGRVPIRGDIIANGLTVLPWRQELVEFSAPTFLTQVWLVARSDSSIQPIEPSGDTAADIARVKALLRGQSLLGKAHTCLDPALYSLQQAGAKIQLFGGTLNELVPAILNGDADLTLLDVPDALIALEKWPGTIKVIGPIASQQTMACAFARSSPQLRAAFDRFLDQCKKDGTYLHLVRKYYPAAPKYYPEFFKNSGR